METASRIRRVCAAAVLWSILLLLAPAQKVTAICYAETGCGGGWNCIRLPTGLPAVDIIYPVDPQYPGRSWETAGAGCGVRPCWELLCPCGWLTPLASGVCHE